MSLFYRNLIIGSIWGLILWLIIKSNSSQLFLSMLFTVFILYFSEKVFSSIKETSILLKKYVSLFVSTIVLIIISFFLFKSLQFMWSDLNKLIELSQPIILSSLGDYGLEKNIRTIEDIYEVIITFLKSHLSFITFSTGLFIKIIIGIVIGVIIYFSETKIDKIDNVWDYISSKIIEQSKDIYNSFKDIIEIQLQISIMNTLMVSFMAFAITYMFFGQFLPYWYVIVPLTAILSLIPIVGNIMINLILILSTIQLSLSYVFVGIGIFLIIHKLELIVIGKKMKKKVDIPFLLILLSMLIGEMLFHSMSGMILGMVMLVTLSKILKKIKIKGDKNEKSYQERQIKRINN